MTRRHEPDDGTDAVPPDAVDGSRIDRGDSISDHGAPDDPGPGRSGAELMRREVGQLVSQLSAEDLGTKDRGRLLLRLGRSLTGSVRAAGTRAAVSGRFLVDAVTDLAPHLPVRDLQTLRRHHDGLSEDDLALALVRSAARVTASVGAAGGAVAAAEFAAPPALLAAPVQLLAETLVVVSVELKLVAELHAVYGRVPVGTRTEVALAHLDSWARKRGLDPVAGRPPLASVLSSAARQQLRSRLARRVGRNLSTFAPFLAGAAAGAELNRRETKTLGEALIRDLHPR